MSFVTFKAYNYLTLENLSFVNFNSRLEFREIRVTRSILVCNDVENLETHKIVTQSTINGLAWFCRRWGRGVLFDSVPRPIAEFTRLWKALVHLALDALATRTCQPRFFSTPISRRRRKTVFLPIRASSDARDTRIARIGHVFQPRVYIMTSPARVRVSFVREIVPLRQHNCKVEMKKKKKPSIESTITLARVQII